MATGERLTDALVELVEDIFGVDQTAEAVVVADKDAAIEAVVNAITGF